jgi:TolB-like protein/DNA-binding winged helix-turn-helix (wHTH) protein/Tfp pilus assembly protein PilF
VARSFTRSRGKRREETYALELKQDSIATGGTLPLACRRFGEFELDPVRYELRRNGRVLKLERIPMELLILLAEKDGHVVSRQEIMERLWGNDVFVDTEHGINTAVRKIRLALKDDPDKPRFVQTVTGKGYRFVAEQRNGNGVSLLPGLDARSTPQLPVGVHEIASNAVARWRKAFLLSLIAIFVLGALTYAGWRFSRRVPEKTEHIMLAVLPFENLSGDPGQEYFSDGLTEEIIAQLGALSPEQLGVMSRTTSMAYKHTSKSVQQIGQELGVDYVLESSVRRDADQVRITAQLIRTRDQTHVWAQNYDRHITGSIALQEEVARAVANQIEVKLSPVYANRPKKSQRDEQTTEAYLRGRYFENQFTPEGYRKAISYFQQAIDRDPSFAEAYSGIADSYRFLVVTDSVSPSEDTPKVVEAARRAVLLGDDLAESHNAMANAMSGQFDLPGNEQESRRAILLNRSYSNAHRIYAALLAAERRHAEAWEQINEAMRTDPLSPPNNAEMVRTLYYARDYDRAIQQAHKAMQLDPGYYRTHFWLGRVYAQKKMYKEAIAEAETVLKATPDSNLGLTEMAYSLALGGRHSEARMILGRLKERKENTFVPAYNLAVIHTALNENVVALDYLQQAYDEHDWALMVIATEPRLDPLRNENRFQELAKKIGLPI